MIGGVYGSCLDNVIRDRWGTALSHTLWYIDQIILLNINCTFTCTTFAFVFYSFHHIKMYKQSFWYEINSAFRIWISRSIWMTSIWQKHWCDHSLRILFVLWRVNTAYGYGSLQPLFLVLSTTPPALNGVEGTYTDRGHRVEWVSTSDSIHVILGNKADTCARVPSIAKYEQVHNVSFIDSSSRVYSHNSDRVHVHVLGSDTPESIASHTRKEWSI